MRLRRCGAQWRRAERWRQCRTAAWHAARTPPACCSACYRTDCAARPDRASPDADAGRGCAGPWPASPPQVANAAPPETEFTRYSPEWDDAHSLLIALAARKKNTTRRSLLALSSLQVQALSARAGGDFSRLSLPGDWKIRQTRLRGFHPPRLNSARSTTAPERVLAYGTGEGQRGRRRVEAAMPGEINRPISGRGSGDRQESRGLNQTARHDPSANEQWNVASG